MKFYVASSFTNKEKVRHVIQQLTERGFVLTYDWTENNRAATLEELQDIGAQEKTAVLNSNFVIVLLPAGKGSHIEMGLALAANKKIFLYSANDEFNNMALTSTFYHLPEVEKVTGTIDDLLSIVCSSDEITLSQ